jgi:3-isopropylmalate dehydrogenase
LAKKIIVLPGDGVGPEVTREAIKVLKAAALKAGIQLEILELLAGGISLDAYGVPIREDVIDTCRKADAVFLGAIGGPKWDNQPKERRPEIALFRLRKELGLFTNLRPVKVYDALKGSSSLKPDLIEGVDILVVRELTGGLYFGQPKFTESLGREERAVDTMEYRTSEIERIAREAFRYAGNRRRHVISVDKANVLQTSQLWRKTVTRMGKLYPEINLEHMLVDNTAMQLLRNPKQFDVLLTENLFGDILSDEAAVLTGSIGVLPSASLGAGVGLYEPIHGSAPDIAGKNVANPLASILSVAMMFRYSFQMEPIAFWIEQAVEAVLNKGYRTADIFTGQSGEKLSSTHEMGDEVAEVLGGIAPS